MRPRTCKFIGVTDGGKLGELQICGWCGGGKKTSVALGVGGFDDYKIP